MLPQQNRPGFWIGRLLSTALLVPIIAYGARHGKTGMCSNDCRWRIGLIAFALLILDHVDSPLFAAQNIDNLKENKRGPTLECRESYQFADKMVDQVQYAVALALLWAYCGFWSPVIVIAYLLRWIGVTLFAHDGSVGYKAKRWLALFPDVTKELLLLVAVLGPAGATPTLIALVIVGKYLFELGRLVYATKTCDSN